MEIVRLLISGNGSLLMNNPVSMRGAASDRMERGGKKIPLPRDEALSKLYVLPSGQLYAKSDWFREAGLIAASEVKDPSRKGRATMTRRFASSVFLVTDHCPLFRNGHNGSKPVPITSADTDWEIDTRRVVVQRNGILRSRPKLTDWSCEVQFEYDPELNQPELILAVMRNAGKYPGVGDYRVGKKGAFGRFTVELLNGSETKSAPKAKATRKSRERELVTAK
jgi:hypothetical protein